MFVWLLWIYSPLQTTLTRSSSCLIFQEEASKRPTAAEALQHHWILVRNGMLP